MTHHYNLSKESPPKVNKATTRITLDVNDGHASPLLEVLNMLFERGVDIDLEDKRGQTPLHQAAKNGDVEAVKLLLKLGANVNAADLCGRTPLYVASEHNQVEVMKVLLAGRVKKEVVVGNLTPLGFACFRGSMTVTKLLLERGAKINQCKTETAPLTAASIGGRLEMVRFLLDNRATVSQNALAAAAAYGHDKVVGLLLDKGARFDMVNRDGMTVLDIATENGHVEVVKLLLARGASIDSFNASLVLCTATTRHHFGVVEFLLRAGATMTDSSCGAAVCNALEAGKIGLCNLLVQTHPQVAVTEPKLLRTATESKQPESIELMKGLLNHDAPVDWHDASISTALDRALYIRNVDKVRLLVLHGANTEFPRVVGSLSKIVLETEWSYSTPFREAMLDKFWTPNNHKFHPLWTRNAIACTLLVAKRQHWPFDQLLMRLILSYIAFGWYQRNVP